MGTNGKYNGNYNVDGESHSASRAGVLMSYLCWVHMIARIQ